jgi:hypothetical protein
MIRIRTRPSRLATSDASDPEFRRNREHWAIALFIASVQAGLSVFLHGEIGYAVATGAPLDPPAAAWPLWVAEWAATTGLCLLAFRSLYWVLRTRTFAALNAAAIRYVLALGGLLLFIGVMQFVLDRTGAPGDPVASLMLALGLGTVASGMRGVVARLVAWAILPVRRRLLLARAQVAR